MNTTFYGIESLFMIHLNSGFAPELAKIDYRINLLQVKHRIFLLFDVSMQAKYA